MIVAKEKEEYPMDTCVVSGDKLGGDMGAPVDFVYRPTNQLVRFCCDGCVDAFKKTPDKYPRQDQQGGGEGHQGREVGGDGVE